MLETYYVLMGHASGLGSVLHKLSWLTLWLLLCAQSDCTPPCTAVAVCQHALCASAGFSVPLCCPALVHRSLQGQTAQLLAQGQPVQTTEDLCLPPMRPTCLAHAAILPHHNAVGLMVVPPQAWSGWESIAWSHSRCRTPGGASLLPHERNPF